MATARFGSTATKRLVWTLPQPIQGTTFPLRGQAPVPPKPEPPTPEPPKPEPPAMPNWTIVHKETLLDFIDKKGIPRGTGEEHARTWTHELCEQFAFTFPGQGYGHKRADSGRPHSADVVAKQENGRLYGWDVLLDAGGPNCKPILSPSTIDLTGQVFEPVTPRDHIGSQPIPTPPPVPPPPAPTPPVSYGQFVSVEAPQVRDRYRSVHGREPAPSDLAHNAWRRLVEGWSHQAILDDIR